MHWLTMRVEDVTPATELYPTFRQYVLQPAGDAEALVRELVSDAAVIRSFDRQPLGGPEAALFDLEHCDKVMQTALSGGKA